MVINSWSIKTHEGTTELWDSTSGGGSAVYLLVFKEDLLADTRYKMKMTSTTAATTAGSFGPIIMQTQSSSSADAVVYARNPTFGYIFLAANPKDLVFTAGYFDTPQASYNYPQASTKGFVEITSFGALGVSELIAPFQVKVEMSSTLF